MTAQPEHIKITGRILYLTKDPELLQRQLDGEDLDEVPAPEDLVDNISTDEITPAWVCYYYDRTLAHYSMVGLRGGVVKPGALESGGFEVLVAGISMGCGSSRETAPASQLWAGIKLVIAQSVEKIYGQNSQNIGLLTSTDMGLLERIRAGQEIPLSEFTDGLDPISTQVVRSGGLFSYNKARKDGTQVPHVPDTQARPMTMVEKIIARNGIRNLATNEIGVEAVKPGDALFVRSDLRFSHEYVTPMAEAFFSDNLGDDARVQDPQSVVCFRDHLTFLEQAITAERKQMGLLDKAQILADVQSEFAQKHGIRLYGEIEGGGSEAICHNAVLEDLALPGQVVTGTDSHTCTAGALGCFAFGVGATDMANAWYTRDVRVRVPQSVRFHLSGTLGADLSAKDVMLHILSLPYFKEGKAIGQVLEFGGPALALWDMDERATLTNMAVEGGGTTGIIPADEMTYQYLCDMRGAISRDEFDAGVVTPDENAQYAARFDIDLSTLSPMVATPGDPRNGVPLQDLDEREEIQIAYGGSCTGGKMHDMDLYAQVLQVARERGQRVPETVEFYIQFGSQKIKEYARSKGYIELFEEVGARLIDPSCGACINAGPGVSRSPEQVSVSAINRNFPGRSGPGRVYLASPLVVAASALAGRIAAPSEV